MRGLRLDYGDNTFGEHISSLQRTPDNYQVASAVFKVSLPAYERASMLLRMVYQYSADPFKNKNINVVFHHAPRGTFSIIIWV